MALRSGHPECGMWELDTSLLRSEEVHRPVLEGLVQRGNADPPLGIVGNRAFALWDLVGGVTSFYWGSEEFMRFCP